MKTPEAIAQECAEKINRIAKEQEDHLPDEFIARLIAAAIREAVEHELATINAERAETRDIRKEMIKAQDEVAKLRAEVEQYKQDFRDQEKRIGQASRELAQVTGDRNIKRELIVRLNSEATQLRAALAEAEGAGKNLAAELCQWCPHEVRGPVLTQWDQALARIIAATRTP
jgi:chromosome segregation ATPase